jgi:Bacterial antitoxin of type II TA system, VapB
VTAVRKARLPAGQMAILPPLDGVVLLPILVWLGVWHMKTTLDISDPLLREARKIASRERTTLRALVEQGLRKIIAERKNARAFRLRKVTFDGQGLAPELRDVDWDKIRDLAYEGRGG